jgi:hypothetical protein
MANTYYYSTNTTSNLVIGFQRANEDIEVSDLPKLIGESAGGMLSNGNDMSKFLQFFLDENKQDSLEIITQKQAIAMEQLQSDFEIVNHVTSGYSIGMYDKYYGDKKIKFKGHNGSINGFTSDYIYDRELNIGIAVSTNLFQKSNYKVIDLLVNNFADTSKVKTKKPTRKTIDISKFKDWEGTYKMLNGTNELVDFINAPFRTLQIKIKNDSLYVTRFLSDAEVYGHIENNSFKDVKEDLVTLFLCNNDNDKSLVFYEDTFVEINPIKYYASIFLLFMGLLSGLLLTVLLITQLFVCPFRKPLRNSLKTSLMIVLPFWLIMGSIVLYFTNASFLDLSTLGNMTATSVGLFLCTSLFPFFSAYSGYKLFKKQMFFKNPRFRLVYTFVFFGVTFLSVYCLYYGWFALRLWSY